MINEIKILEPYPIINKQESNHLIIQWWEIRRLIYNLIILCSIKLLLDKYWFATFMLSYETILYQSFFYVLAANLFYSLSWFVEILAKKIECWAVYRFFKNNRSFIFILGTLLSLVITCYLYSSVLAPLHPSIMTNFSSPFN